eukprot:NODE_1189_length_1861_cov_0.681044.p1 type:complete len:438 gc:universal NODE_1189_length_1861_cov_0.681044:1314-1(-)
MEFVEYNDFNSDSDTSNVNNITNFNINAKRSLTLEDLMGEDSQNIKHVNALPKPLHQTEQDKLDRVVSYKKVKKEISKWQPLVNYNQKSKILNLPFQKEKGANITVASLAFNLRPENEFEREMMELQHSTGMTEKQIVENEEALINEINEEDVRKHIRELRRLRELSFRYDSKMKHQKKIKSRKYRQILTKEKMRKSVKKLNLEQLRDLNDSQVQENLDELNEKRIEERLSLRHKNLGKWSKLIRKRGLKDPVTRKAIAEQLRIHEELKQKISGVDGTGEKVLEQEDTGLLNDLLDYEFMRPKDMDISGSDSEIIEELEVENPKNSTEILKRLNPEFQFKVPKEDEFFQPKKRNIAIEAESHLSQSPSEVSFADEANDNPWIDCDVESDKVVESFKVDDMGKLEISEQQKSIVQKAFENDNVIEEFVEEKIGPLWEL